MGRSGMKIVGMADILWHMKTNINMQHADHISGQCAMFPVDTAGATENRVCSITNGKVSDGPGASGNFFGVVREVIGGRALVQYAGYADLIVADAVVGEYAYATSDGRATSISAADIKTGAYNPSRIVGMIVENKGSVAGVMVRAKGISGLTPEVEEIAMSGMCGYSGSSIEGAYLMSVARIGTNGVIYDQSNISGCTINENSMTFTFTHPYKEAPIIKVGCRTNISCIVEVSASTSAATIRLFNINHSALDVGVASGFINVIATGEAA